MAVLVADVGGTNARLAIARDGALVSRSITRYRNADHGSFYEVVDDFLRVQAPGEIAACTVALAGPVSSQNAKLTNLDWDISVAGLMDRASCRTALLLNDLTALGYSIGSFPAASITKITEAKPHALHNNQYLVAGLGTGFNVCPVSMDGERGVVCSAAELGHAELPTGIRQSLEGHFGPRAQQFVSVEDCFSGRGLSALHALMADCEPMDGADVFARHVAGADPNSTRALDLLAQLLGQFAREMVLFYMPLGGLFFAGSVARGLFDAGFGDSFQRAFAQHGRFQERLQHVPVSVIQDDAAALVGCVAASSQMQR